MFATYHMRDPQVFYNKEDLWSIPRQTVDGQEREIESYYTIMRLPGRKPRSSSCCPRSIPARRTT